VDDLPAGLGYFGGCACQQQLGIVDVAHQGHLSGRSSHSISQPDLRLEVVAIKTGLSKISQPVGGVATTVQNSGAADLRGDLLVEEAARNHGRLGRDHSSGGMVCQADDVSSSLHLGSGKFDGDNFQGIERTPGALGVL